METKPTTPDAYTSQLPDDRKAAILQLRKTLVDHLPKGFAEQMSYGMIGYVVPHTAYPAGYHCDPTLPLPFISIASQKNFVALYHMGVYADEQLYEWFTTAYAQQSKTKLDMGKSCIRFKKMSDIPYGLIGELAGKMTVKEWIALYESKLKK